MKTIRYITAISILIFGFLAGWFFLSSFVIHQYMTEEMAASFYGYVFYGMVGFKLYSGIISLLAFAIPAMLIWPGENIKRTHKLLFAIVDLICLLFLTLGMVTAVDDFTSSYKSGNRDFFIAPLFILCACIGVIVLGLACLIGVLVDRRSRR
jgi:hypothetical protein